MSNTEMLTDEEREINTPVETDDKTVLNLYSDICNDKADLSCLIDPEVKVKKEVVEDDGRLETLEDGDDVTKNINVEIKAESGGSAEFISSFKTEIKQENQLCKHLDEDKKNVTAEHEEVKTDEEYDHPHESTPIVNTRKHHICNVCDKSFKTPSSLKKHMLIHTGERKFSCTVCGKTFIQSSQMNKTCLPTLVRGITTVIFVVKPLLDHQI